MCHNRLLPVVFSTAFKPTQFDFESVPRFDLCHIWSIWLPFFFISNLPLLPSIFSTSSSSIPLLTHRLPVNQFPVFSFTHPLLSLEPFDLFNYGRFFSLSAPATLHPHPPTHTDSPPLTVPPVFFGDCICVSGASFFYQPRFGCRSPRDLRSIDAQWRPKKMARRRERSAPVSIHPLTCYFTDASQRQNEHWLAGGHASQFVCLVGFFFIGFTCSPCQKRR